MRPLRTLSTVLTLAILSTSVASAQADKKIDVTGKWLFNVTSDLGTGTPTVTLKQVGDSVTGHYSSQTLGEQELKGTFKDSKLTFRIAAQADGQTFAVTYAGTMDGADAMKGTVDFAGQATGTFTAKRQP
jgi:hypothetical protein